MSGEFNGQLCSYCNLENSDQQTVYTPLRIEHWAVAATLRAFKDFDPRKVNNQKYQVLKRIALSTTAQHYSIAYDWDLYMTFGDIIKNVDIFFSSGVPARVNLFWDAQPICCCTLLDKCVAPAGELARLKCINHHPIETRYHYTPIRAHLVNNSSCCCDGYRRENCGKRAYIDLC